MKVVLIQDIENLGKKFEVKEVADGHARNMLIPHGLVKLATPEVIEWAEMQKQIVTDKAEEGLKNSQQIASKLDDLEVQMSVKIGENGQLFESITAQKVADRLKEIGFEVKKNQVKLEDPIKELGEFPVKISLDHNLEAEIVLIVGEE